MRIRRSLSILVLAILSGWTSTAAASAASATKVVSYRGYRIVVPASWPVFDLTNPAVCVRFNRHAVYLGQPSGAQQCPAHAVGRTEAILVQPLAARGARADGARADGAARGAGAAALPATSNRGALPSQGSSARLTLPAKGLLVTTTWGRQPRLIERALGVHSLTRVQLSSAPPARGAASGPRSAGAAAGAAYTGLGFDACSAPSTSRMAAWTSSPYRAVGIYLGGTNLACAQPNLNPGWVSTESAAGWHLIPTYVGLQAPSNGCGCAGINPSRASAQGAAAAQDAVAQAQGIGLGPGNPIYFDMENYARTGSNTAAVLSFLSAWTSQLHADRYKSGVYSNSDSGISDLVAARGTAFKEPDDIWMADWNGLQTTSSPFVPSGDWPNHQRLHQYEGGHNETHRGVTLNVDSNSVDGATAGNSAPPIPDGTFVQVAGSPTIYEIAGGAPLNVSAQYLSALAGKPPAVISSQQFQLLNRVPAGGTVLVTSTGAAYRVAGGAPLYISDRGQFANLLPVLIDEWDIDNVTNPLAHLNPVPANGTFLTTTGGQIYRVAGGAPIAVRNWSVFGGRQPAVTIDQWDIANISNPAAHLSSVPADGTVVQTVRSGSYWLFVGGIRKLTAPVRTAVRVDDAGLAAFPAVPCSVPSLSHLSLSAAAAALRVADCRLGKVRRPSRPTLRRRLYVVKQSAPAASTHGGGYAVGVTLG